MSVSSSEDVWSPQGAIVVDVSRGTSSLIETEEANTFEVGQLVRLIVPLAYGMSINAQGLVTSIISDTEFMAAIDTSTQNLFVVPTFPPAFTPAQVIPVTGTWNNIAVFTAV